MNFKGGLLRIWIVASICWIGGVVYAHGEKLCPAWYWKSPSEVAKERPKLEDEIAKLKREIAGLKQQPADDLRNSSISLRETLIEGNELLLRPLVSGTAGYACITKWSEESARREGGWSADWPQRWQAFKLLFGPPIALPLALALAGFVGLWIVRGFRTSTQLTPDNTGIKSAGIAVKALVGPLGVLAFVAAALASAITLIVILSYPFDAGWVTRKYDWLFVPFVAGAVLPLSGGLGIMARRWVRKRLGVANENASQT